MPALVSILWILLLLSTLFLFLYVNSCSPDLRKQPLAIKILPEHILTTFIVHHKQQTHSMSALAKWRLGRNVRTGHSPGWRTSCEAGLICGCRLFFLLFSRAAGGHGDIPPAVTRSGTSFRVSRGAMWGCRFIRTGGPHRPPPARVLAWPSSSWLFPLPCYSLVTSRLTAWIDCWSLHG